MSKQSSGVRGALQPGTVLREYKIKAVLGYGGYGVVYRARHEELGHEVSIKEYLPADLSVREAGTVYPRSPDCMEVYEDGKRRFLEEAKRIVQFKTDPGVVTCTDFFRANGTAYFVMEYIDGLSLAALLWQRETAGRAFDESDLKSVAVPLLETLLRLHRAGVLHRDIKPSNILIRRSDGQPILIDFGAAKQLTADHTKSAAPYTEGYAAFEQVGEGELGPWTDVYAFGTVLWRMVAGGKPPWEPPNPKRVELRAMAVLAGKPDPQPAAAELGAGRFSEELLAEIDRSLTISVEQRPRGMEEMRHALDSSRQSGGMPKPASDSVRDRGSNSGWPGFTKEFFARVTVEEISRCLLSASVKVKARNNDGETPLHMVAAFSESPEVVKVLLAAGADLHAREKYGATPLHDAARFSKCPEVVQALLDAGASSVAKDGDGKIPWDYARRNVNLKATGAYLRPRVGISAY